MLALSPAHPPYPLRARVRGGVRGLRRLPFAPRLLNDAAPPGDFTANSVWLSANRFATSPSSGGERPHSAIPFIRCRRIRA